MGRCEEIGTWTAASETPVFLLGDEALQPRKRSPGFASEYELQVEDIAVTEHGLGDIGGVPIELEDGEYQGVGDVSLQ